MSLPEIRVRRQEHSSPPAHHVETKPKAAWPSFLSTWSSSPAPTTKSTAQLNDTSKTATEDEKNITRPQSFRNPWPSWYKPNRQEVWNALEWGDDQDPCIKLAAQHSRAKSESIKGGSPISSSAMAAKLLKVQKPDFAFDTGKQKFKVTWLGHAGILLQLPPLQNNQRPFRCVFDPFFSSRCSPNQFAGPLRTYPSPCTVEDLPEIDVVMISHDHYDHLDYDTIMSIWKHNPDTVRFIVPLGNAAWFTSCGIPEERVVDLDWWDSIQFYPATSKPLTITCTPSQHNSGRGGNPPNSTLWSSWFIDHPLDQPLRVFFGGDTGFQYHDSLSWPPSPTNDPSSKESTRVSANDDINGTRPMCPAFEQISQRLGSPDLLLLPVAVGATYDYLRSFVPLPNSINPFPRHRSGLTAANHMPPWDAVRVFQLMTAAATSQNKAPVAVAIHWGTFVTDSVEVLKTLGQLENACKQHEVQFARSIEEVSPELQCFVALDHGQSVSR